MSNMKKLTGIVLVLAMVLSLVPMSVFAADTAFTDVKDTDYYAQAAANLGQMDVLTGYPDGTFGAAKPITRAEMVAVVCRMIGKEAESKTQKGKTAFEDVGADHWASGYVNVASAEGIVNGDGNGKFRPGDNVKYEEAIKMVVCALGYGEGVAVNAADWSAGYLSVAAEKGISANLQGTKGAAATRGDVAVMSCNGLVSTLSAPVASLKSGKYVGTKSVKLTAEGDAEIYYTVNGATPTTASKKYTRPISISKSCTLKAIAVKGGVLVSDVMSVDYSIKKVKGNSSAVAVTGAELQLNGAAATTANVGDTLTMAVTPAEAVGTFKWTVGGNDVGVTGKTYTVTAFDMGKTVKAQFTGTSPYQGTVSAQCTVATATTVHAQDIMTNDADSSPVVLPDVQRTKFLDDAGNPVTVDASSVLTLAIEKPEKPQAEVSAAQTLIIQDIVSDGQVQASDLNDVTTTAVDVNLSVDDTAVHPVGAVTVTLSASQLGLPEGTDLSLHTFSASHTNKEGDDEIVAGEVVTIDGIQYVRFTLNGLSTVWIGNVPPRTVSFYNTEADADSKVNSIGSVVVKFGDFTPTAQIPTPERAGNLFRGWNYDMTRTPIITHLEVHALWIEGEKMPEENVTAALSAEVDGVTPAVTAGLVTLDCADAQTLAPNLTLRVSVTAPANAVKYYAGTNAAVVAAFDKTDEYLDAASAINIVTDVTDENGLVIPSATTYYYKWMDAEGKPLALQEIAVKIAGGTDGATSKQVTANVDRGIGTFEGWLIHKTDAAKNYIGYINNNLSGSATDGYTLNNSLSFDSYRLEENFDAYASLKLIFTPFEGESFSASDTVAATGEYYDYNVEEYVPWQGSYELSGNQLIVTYPFSEVGKIVDYGDMTVSVNGKEQTIGGNWYGSSQGSERINCETWAEVLTALQTVSADKEYYLYCRDSSAITLSQSLTIPANVDIYLSDAVSFTVANGATLTLAENKALDWAVGFRAYEAEFIVENGGKIVLTYTGADDGSVSLANLSVHSIKLDTGASVTIPENTGLSLYGEDDGTFTMEPGSVLETSGHCHIRNFDAMTLNGTVNCHKAYPYFYADEIHVGGRMNMVTDQWGRMELHGTVTVEETGAITVNNTASYRRNLLEIYGPLTNKGSITVTGNTTAEIMNNGFVIYNEGTITVDSNCVLNTTGTKYINTGVMTGGGKVLAQLGDDYTNYDDGTEYVQVENDEYWDSDLGKYVYLLADYSRYKYTHEPAKTVEAILYLAEIVNVGSGTCSLTIDAEAFPE